MFIFTLQEGMLIYLFYFRDIIWFFLQILRLNHSSVSKITAGHIVNFLSNDLLRFDFALPWVNYVWIMPIELVVGTALAWYLVGDEALAGIITLVVITLPLQG